MIQESNLFKESNRRTQNNQSPISQKINNIQNNNNDLSNVNKLSMYHDYQYVDYIITNHEVQKFLKRCFVYNGMNNNDISQTNSARSFFGPSNPSTPQQQQQFTSRMGSVSPKRLICDTWDRVPVTYFVRSLLQEFPDVIEEQNISDSLLHQLKQNLKQLICDDDQPQYLSLNKLQLQTKSVGLLGLLTQALRHIVPNNNDQNKLLASDLLIPPQYHNKNNYNDLSLKDYNGQNNNNNKNDYIELKLLKNTLQDYSNNRQQEMEDIINERINEQMRRLVTKTRDIERVIIQAQGKIDDNYDLFQRETRSRNILKELQSRIQEQQYTINELSKENSLLKQQQIDGKQLNQQLSIEKEKIIQEYEKIQIQCEEYQKQIQKQNDVMVQLQYELFEQKKRQEAQIYSSIEESDGIVLAQSPTKYLDVRSIHHTPKQSTVINNRGGLKFVSSGIVSTQTNELSQNNNCMITKVLLESLNAWEGTSKHEEYRFSCILTTPENVKLSFQYYQLLPTIRNIPGFNEFIVRAQNLSFLMNYWISNIFSVSNEQQSKNQNLVFSSSKLTDLYENTLCTLKQLSSDAEAISILSLLLNIIHLLQLIQQTIRIQDLKDWYGQCKKGFQDPQQRFLLCFNNSLALIINYQRISIDDEIENKFTIRQQLQLINQKFNNPQIQNQIKLLNMFYSNNPSQECINIMKVLSETELNVNTSKAFLNTDAVNLYLFPALKTSSEPLQLLDSLLHFKCPGQYYAQYTEQVCRKGNVELLSNIAMQLYNKSNHLDVIGKIWEVLGAIAKSIELKCSKNLWLELELQIIPSNLAKYLGGQEEP